MNNFKWMIVLVGITGASLALNVLTNMGYIGNWILFGLYLVLLVLGLLGLILTLIGSGLNLLPVVNISLKGFATSALKITLIGILMLVVQTVISDVFKFTPKTAELASIETVELNGREEAITIRGKEDAPVILFLAGGPGGSQVQATRMFFDELEEDYTIINWEQPGSGMSYGVIDQSELTVDTYIEDGHALTQYLKDRFNQEKIYIIGESWGSYLGIELVKAYPEDYHAIITAGQMVDFVETEIYCYHKAIEVATERNDTDLVETLEALGEPPYYEGNLGLTSGKYLTYLHQYMNTIDDVNRTSYDTFDDLFSPEYSILDSINYLRALLFTFDTVYRQLYETDLRESLTELEVPIYIMHGRHDINAPLYLAEDYFEQINAPVKEMIIYEHSGHNPWINEPELFQENVARIIESTIDN
jgi:pimeloyl-ACP methyl ester carboxylesterase